MNVVGITFCAHCDQCVRADEQSCRRCGHHVIKHELNQLLADEGEPATCMEEIERWREWQTENLRRLA